MALSEERCLPASVRGPVECWALARLTAARYAAARIRFSYMARSAARSRTGLVGADILFCLGLDIAWGAGLDAGGASETTESVAIM